MTQAEQVQVVPLYWGTGLSMVGSPVLDNLKKSPGDCRNRALGAEQIV